MMKRDAANNNTPVARLIESEPAAVPGVLEELQESLTHSSAVNKQAIDRPVAGSGSVEGRYARTLLRERRIRDQAFGDDIFSDPSWDILLALFAAHEEGLPVPISSLCLAAAVPPSTALRHIAHLTQRGWIERRYDPVDRRAIFAAMSQPIIETMRSFIRQTMPSRSA